MESGGRFAGTRNSWMQPCMMNQVVFCYLSGQVEKAPTILAMCQSMATKEATLNVSCWNVCVSLFLCRPWQIQSWLLADGAWDGSRRRTRTGIGWQFLLSWISFKYQSVVVGFCRSCCGVQHRKPRLNWEEKCLLCAIQFQFWFVSLLWYNICTRTHWWEPGVQWQSRKSLLLVPNGLLSWHCIG